MSIRINAHVTLTGIAPLELLHKLGPEDRNKAAAQSVTYLVQRHLTEYNRSHPNKLGGKRTNHYRQLAQSTNWKANEEQAIVAISDYRAAMSILGGEIRPGKNPSFKTGLPTKALTVPASSESYGERAKKFDGKSQLIWFKHAKGDVVGMIIDRIQQRLAPGKVRKDGEIVGGKLNEKGVFKFKRVLYWLLARATIKPRPDAIPTNQEITQGAVAGVRLLVQTVFNKNANAVAVVYGRSV